ncbi:hypothetical protein B0H14DRAFT_2603659 [Mycena olivaceomarginata]|nr:hypothetical protein B0H14DRAFT_2603659 [Mycena olivaceomarginata]
MWNQILQIIQCSRPGEVHCPILVGGETAVKAQTAAMRAVIGLIKGVGNVTEAAHRPNRTSPPSRGGAQLGEGADSVGANQVHCPPLRLNGILVNPRRGRRMVSGVDGAWTGAAVRDRDGSGPLPGRCSGAAYGGFTQHLSFSPAALLSAPSSLSFLSVPLPTLSPGYNHSGKLGLINFLDGVLGYMNVQRMINYIRFIFKFILQPGYQD